jgi:GNAT superfamily N-acetyltransferase
VIEELVVEMMGEDFILWRCLHGGPLTRESIEQWPQDQALPWAEFRARNVPLLSKLTRAYGACAVLARDGEAVVGTLRFYPKALCPTPRLDCFGMCLQQPRPNGPPDNFAEADFPPLDQLADKTLFVHCLMLAADAPGRPSYRRRGFGRRMAERLTEWGREKGWQAVEATAYEDLDIVYSVTGVAGKTFWERLGFHVAEVGVEAAFEHYPDILKVVIEQGRALGLSADAAKTKYTMRLELA